MATFLQVPYQEHEIILNTPNRNEILKEGPPQNCSSNILGRGAYGTVFKAVFNAKQVAVKIVKNLKDMNLQSMRNEAHILGWKHRNIVRILKIESTSNFGIVIMERFAGQCLQKILDSIDLTLLHRVFISLDILCALVYCHRRNLLHLDVKPQNILVAFDNEQYQKTDLSTQLLKRRSYVCKLCDFGSSLKMGAHKENVTRSTTKGTVRYMSPEALREEPLTPAADIYSLGITMWQLQQRKLPYYWIECNEVVAYQVVKNEIRPDSHATLLSVLNQRNMNEQHCNCLCEHFSSEISYRSLAHIKHLLQQSSEQEVSSKQAVVAHYNARLSPQPIVREGRHFRELSPQMNANLARDTRLKLRPQVFANVTRDLREDFGVLKRCALQPEQPKVSGEQDAMLKSIFRYASSSSHSNNLSQERIFDTLYKSCWHSDYKRRSSAAELRQKLERFFMNR